MVNSNPGLGVLSLARLSWCAGDEAVWACIARSEAGAWTCTVCAYSTHHRTNLYQHVEAKHVPSAGYSCPHCTKFCPNSKSLKNHKTRCQARSPRIA